MEQWKKILSECSLRLMSLLVDKKCYIYEKLKTEISNLKESHTDLIEHSDYQKLSDNLTNKIEKLEKEIMDKKTHKFKRDKKDYDMNTIYNWSQSSSNPNRFYTYKNRGSVHKSILKTPREKRVSFFGTDFDSYDSNYESDSGGCSFSPLSSQTIREIRSKETGSEVDIRLNPLIRQKTVKAFGPNGKRKQITTQASPERKRSSPDNQNSPCETEGGNDIEPFNKNFHQRCTQYPRKSQKRFLPLLEQTGYTSRLSVQITDDQARNSKVSTVYQRRKNQHSRVYQG
ncbi:hypothetical protein XENTR_v10018584 [Xenopus tropicalis]|nr:hypothetical protein XENTR_v10018584 [Xenopus tropicalis]